MKNDKEIKIQNLRAKRHQATLEIGELVKAKNKAQKIYENLNKEVNAKAMQIRAYSTEIGLIKTGEKQGKVTDHAIVRYLERYKGFDIEAVANEILEHPDAKFREDGIVTTIFEEDDALTEEARNVIKLARMKKII